MKLAQRLLIGYYKTRLNIIGLFSPRKAAAVAFNIFCTPHTSKPSIEMPAVFRQAEPLSFEIAGSTIRGFRWLPVNPNGKKILIAHGFQSYAYKFEQYVVALQKQGFDVLAFDAPAHGASGGKTVNAYIYKNALQKIESLYGPLYGIMGHSLGGLAASIFFEELPAQQNRKLVLIAPAETDRAIQNFLAVIPLSEKVRVAFTQLIDEITDRPVSYYSTGRVVKKLSSPVLWVHDQNDPVCPFEDVQPLLLLDLPHVTFLVTEHLGHNKIYRDDKVCSVIVQFFSRDIS